MLTNRKSVLFIGFFMLLVAGVFAATDELVTRYLNQATDAFEDGNIEEAYKRVNLALALADNEESDAGLLYTAKSIYGEKLQQLMNKYNADEYIDVTQNLEKYPALQKDTKIKKLVLQIQTDQAAKKEAEQKRIEEERFAKQQESMANQSDLMKQQAAAAEKQAAAMQEQAEAVQRQAEAIKEQAEVTKRGQEEMKAAITSGFTDIGTAFSETAAETKRSTKVIAMSIIGIALLIVFIVFIIVIIARKSFKQQELQQAQYVQAFKLLAANQSQTNRLMLGGVTDLYGSNPTLRIAGSSSWAGSETLPDLDITPEDEEELKKLAVKCEEIGAEIDRVTGRKNNSKNVSEIVYKLSMQLGLTSGVAMLYFCASMIYDAGFLEIDPEIMSAETLTDDQKEQMKEHVNLAEKHLDFVPKKYWTVFEDASMKHHENMDGSGYPKGLEGDSIPQIARLIRVAETYVSLSSKRNYRETMDKEEAVQMLRSQPQFYDPAVVDALDQIL